MSRRKHLSLDDIDNNPFIYIKIRKIILWYVLISTGVFVQLILIDLISPVKLFIDRQDFEFVDPIYGMLLYIPVSLLLLSLLSHQGKLHNIKTRLIIGKVHNNFRWLPIILLASCRIIFSVGLYRVYNYPLSFIAPQWVENHFSYSIYSEALKSFSPLLYLIISILIFYVLWTIVSIVIIEGIVLHRLATKWGTRKAIFAISLYYGISFNANFISGFILGMILCLLYIKSRTLIVPIVFRIITLAIYLIAEAYYFFMIKNNIDNFLERFQSEFKIGIILTTISTPYIIYWLYKNWVNPDEQLPYFANADRFND